MKCKICNGKIKFQCRCVRGDTVCENGHSYHYSPYHKEYHEGKSDHSTEAFSPNCCKEKKTI